MTPPAGGETVVIENVGQYQYVDAMFEGIRLAIAQRGDEYDAAYIQGISGMAFRIAGPCPCAPTCSMGMSTDALAELLGYEIERLYLGTSEDDFANSVLEVIARVKSEIDAGRTVPVWHAFTNAEWDVVCGYDDETSEFIGWGSWHHGDGEAYARAPQVRMKEAVGICPAYGALIIGEKTGEFDPREAELDAIEEAIRHCHADGGPLHDQAIRSGRKAQWRFLTEGKVCYEVWAHQFRSDPDQVPWGPGNAYPMGVYSSVRSAAGRFLRQIAPKYPEAEALFIQAAEHFEVDAATLKQIQDELLGWSAGWDEPDPKKAAQAAELLTKARKAYGKGMKAMENGLKAIDPARCERAHVRAAVLRGDDGAEIRHVRPLEWEKGQDCTFIGAMAEQLRQTDGVYTYSDLMGLSGLALRLRYSNADTKTGWCPSCAVGEFPDEYALLTKQTGWTLPSDWLEAEGRDNDALAARIVAEIDAGRLLVAYPGHFNMALVFGYEDGGKTLIVNDYMDKTPAVLDSMSASKRVKVPIEKFGPLVTFLGEQNTPPPPPKALKRALRTALENWSLEKDDGGVGGREYWYGEAAWKAWIGDLRDYESIPAEAKDALRGLDWWVYTQLFDARKAAVQFLKDWSNVADGDARDALLKAGGHYQDEVDTLDTLVPDKRAAVSSDGAPEWTEDDREREIEILTEAYELEQKAMAELGRALAAME